MVSRAPARVRLQGKTALVTGASRNIGRAIALAFAAEGANLVVNTRTHRDELEAVAAVESMVRQGTAELGGIDVLVGCAGQSIVSTRRLSSIARTISSGSSAT